MSDIDVLKRVLNIFLLFAVCVSVAQQVKTYRGESETGGVDATGAVPEQSVSTNGTLIADLVIQVTDKYDKPMREILAKHGFAAQIQAYEFKDNSWWLNAFFNYGHIVIVYVLMGAYQKETDSSTKKKIMILGVAAVLAWFFLIPQFKEQRLALKYKGEIIHDSPTLDQDLLIAKLSDLDEQSAFDTPTNEFDL